jgi:hypothetical protein
LEARPSITSLKPASGAGWKTGKKIQLTLASHAIPAINMEATGTFRGLLANTAPIAAAPQGDSGQRGQAHPPDPRGRVLYFEAADKYANAPAAHEYLIRAAQDLLPVGRQCVPAVHRGTVV